MTSENHSPEFKLFANAAEFIKKDFDNDSSMWKNSPFEWVLQLPAGSKGRLGKLLVKQWCALKDLPVGNSPDSQADLTINGHRVEVKFSTLWKNGIYKFQQIRDQKFDYCVCLGISPQEAHCWVLSKSILLQRVIGHLGQHTGSSGKETAWLTVDPQKPPEWIIPYGGNLDEAFKVLKSLSHKK